MREAGHDYYRRRLARRGGDKENGEEATPTHIQRRATHCLRRLESSQVVMQGVSRLQAGVNLAEVIGRLKH